jgi:hypothetical protein
MIKHMFARFIRTLVLLLTVWGIPTQSMADQIVLPAGQACPDFGITIDITVPEQRVMKTFYDKNGNPVRYLNAGKGNQFVFTNSTSGLTLSVKTGGSVEHITPNPDGTQTWVTSGHELVVLFPTDTPPGPATTLYIGRLVFTIDPTSFTFLGIRSFTGKSIDICAALAG